MDEAELKGIASKVLQANLANIAKKVKEGKTLNKEERQLFEKFTETEAPAPPEATPEIAPTLTALAERLGVALRTVQRWRKKYSDAPAGLVVSEWVAFRNLVDGPREDENLAAKKARAEIRRTELACKKLELEIAKIEGSLVARDDVREDGAKIGAIIKQAFAKLQKELTGRLEGKTPAERIVETRVVVAETIEAITKEIKQV